MMEKYIRVDCRACQMIRCLETKGDLPDTKIIIGLDGSMCFNYPEPVLQCEVLRKDISEEQFLMLLGWYTLQQALLEETD